METLIKILLFALRAYSILFTIYAGYVIWEASTSPEKYKVDVSAVVWLILAYSISLYSWFV